MAAKHLKHFPKPLLDDLVANRWLPIVGAGLSRNAVLPSGQTMPLWNELGKFLAEDMQDYEYENPIDSISAYEHKFGRAKLIEKLSNLLFINKAQLGKTHRTFCAVQFDIVCTTNFDFLLEKGYENISRPYTPVIEQKQLSINRTPSTALLKLHGDLNHPDRLVATEEDYDLFVERYPVIATYLSNLFITRTAVLIGYSLDDPDFRQLWKIVGKRLGKVRRPAYALCVGARTADIARFKRRGVEVINLSKNKANYGKILSEVFEELRDYWQESFAVGNQVIEEESLQEFLFPKDSPTRLCYFTLPSSVRRFYRERVFPLVREAGFVPVTRDDVISPGDNLVAKIEALISKAFLVLIDASSNFASVETRIAITRKKADRVRIIFEEGTTIPLNIRQAQILKRPDLESDEVETFLAALDGWFKEAAKELKPRLVEAHRLLHAKEYRAAVISAISHLETTIRNRDDLQTQPIRGRGRKFIPFRQRLVMASDEDLLRKSEVQRILRWLKIRNDVVHKHTAVSAREARQIVKGIEEITSSPRWQKVN